MSRPAPTTSTPEITSRRDVPKHLAFWGFALMAISFMINAMDRQVFYPLLPEISKAHHFSLSQGGLLATGFTLGVAAAGVPAGYLVDKFSRKTVLVASIFVYSVGTIVTPLAAGFADMAVYRLISGAGEGMQAAALYAALSSYFFVRRSLAFGALGVAFGAGVFFGPLIGTDLATSFGTWHAPFYVFGGAGLVITLLIGISVRRGLTDAVAEPEAGATGTFDHLPTSAYNRNTLLLALAAIGGGLAFYGFLGLYPTYLRTELHFTAGQAALATSLVGAGATMSLPTGWLGDRYDQRKILLVTYIGVAVSGWLLFNGPTTPGWQYVFAFTMGTFTAGSLFTNCNSTMQRSVRPTHVGRAAGLFVATYYVAAAVSGFVFAELVGGLGWRHAALWQLTIMPLAILVPLWFLDPAKIISHRRRDQALQE
ncbi:MFS transporter [Amycolatopsis sp. WQ 127309]|uniref:MFS transporter n=1 Tax=Amycolatopsis sp. WQ 127309 TaxID=2932773 RepID=UPI001FF3CAFB|nr:MFS transporter [Amycolatopsis sp. WQ 127309]UOZ03463.1 MFS transporter [Amycolatopsis sp. WQ 127309]